MNNRYENEDASGECQVTGLLSVEKFTAPKLSLTSDSTWPSPGADSQLMTVGFRSHCDIRVRPKAAFARRPQSGSLLVDLPAIATSKINKTNIPKV